MSLFFSWNYYCWATTICLRLWKRKKFLTPWPCFFPSLGGPAEHGLHTVYISKLAKISFLICRRVAFRRHGSGKIQFLFAIIKIIF